MGALVNGVPQAQPKIGGVTQNAYLAGQKVWAEEKVVLGFFSFVINSGADSAFIIPTSFVGAASAYNWRINWNDGSPEQTVSGTSAASNTTGIPHTFPRSNTDYTVTIDPVSSGVGSLRAFGFTDGSAGSLAAANKAKLRRIVRHASLMAFCLSATDTGDATLGHTFRNCTQLTNALEEIIEGAETLTRIGNNFRSGQYLGCTALRTPAAEAMPEGITTIGTYFRQDQYSSSGVTVAAAEALPSTLSGTLGIYFRTQQYIGCSSLTTAPASEVLPAGITAIGNFFRNSQYSTCPHLTNVPQEIIPASVTSIGSDFRNGQYYNCGSITQAPPEFLPAGLISVGNGFRRIQYQGTGLTAPATESMPAGVTTIGATAHRQEQYRYCEAMRIGGHIHDHRFANWIGYYRFFNGWRAITLADTMPRYYLDASRTATAPVTDLTPPSVLGYVTFRTGIEGYADLHANWK